MAKGCRCESRPQPYRLRRYPHQKGPKPGRKKMAVVGTVYQVDRYQRTPEEVVQALFREPGAAAPRDEAAPSRPVPEHKRSRVNLTDPEAATPVGVSRGDVCLASR